MRYERIVLRGLLGVLLIALLSSIGCSKDYQLQDSGKLEVQPPQMFFPSPLEGETATQQVVLKNTGEGVVVVSDAAIKEDLKTTARSALTSDHREFSQPSVVSVLNKKGATKPFKGFPIVMQSGDSLVVSVSFQARDSYADHAKLNFTVQGVSSLPDGNLSIDVNSGGTQAKLLTRNPVVIGGSGKVGEQPPIPAGQASCLDEVVENSGKANMKIRHVQTPQDSSTSSLFKAYIYTEQPHDDKCNGESRPFDEVKEIEDKITDPANQDPKPWDQKQILTVYPQALKNKKLGSHNLDKFWVRYFFYPIDSTEVRDNLFFVGDNISDGNKVQLIGNPKGLCITLIADKPNESYSNAFYRKTIKDVKNGGETFTLKNCSRETIINNIDSLSFENKNFEIIDTPSGELKPNEISSKFKIKVVDTKTNDITEDEIKSEDRGRRIDDVLIVNTSQGNVRIPIPGLLVKDIPADIILTGRDFNADSSCSSEHTITSLTNTEIIDTCLKKKFVVNFSVNAQNSTCKQYKKGTGYVITLYSKDSAQSLRGEGALTAAMILTSDNNNGVKPEALKHSWTQQKETKDGKTWPVWTMEIPVEDLTGNNFSISSAFIPNYFGELHLVATVTDPCGITSTIDPYKGVTYHVKKDGAITVTANWRSFGGRPVTENEPADMDLHVLKAKGNVRWGDVTNNAPNDAYWKNQIVPQKLCDSICDSSSSSSNSSNSNSCICHLGDDKNQSTEIVSIFHPDNGAYDIGVQATDLKGFNTAMVSLEVYQGEYQRFKTDTNPGPQYLLHDQFWWIARLCVKNGEISPIVVNRVYDSIQEANNQRATTSVASCN